MLSLNRDYDALAYNPRKTGEERGAINHIKKVKQKAKALRRSSSTPKDTDKQTALENSRRVAEQRRSLN